MSHWLILMLMAGSGGSGGESFAPTGPAGPATISGPAQFGTSPAGKGGGIAGGGACCVFDGSCVPVADMGECNGLGGVLLEGEDCGTGPCGLGACCQDLDCNMAEAFPCITAGRTFAGAGTTCLDDPCEAGIGACCVDGDCGDLSPEACDAIGGAWLGAGTDCGRTPCIEGGCCLPGLCLEMAQFQCAKMGGQFAAGVECAAGACDVPNDCPADSLFSQSRDSGAVFTAYTSEQASGFTRFENFSGVIGGIDGLTWWGLEAKFIGGQGFVPCKESVPLFHVALHADVGGLPGAQVCAFDVVASRIETGIDYQGFQLMEYSAALPSACVLTGGWVSIVGQGDRECWFLWISAIEGDARSICDGCASEVEPDDVAVCLLGSAGGIFGACCNQSTGTCIDDAEIVDCAATGFRFVPDTDCSELVPACQVDLGGCCFMDTPCTVEVPADCAAAGGTWQGAGSTCAVCPAIGGCCVDFETCFLLPEDDCFKIGSTWSGPDTTCDDCPGAPECTADVLAGQIPNDPTDFIAGTSEASAGFARFDDFSEVIGPITSLRWWGLDLDNIGGPNFVECVEPDPTFEISFHEDAAGVPGAVVCAHTLTASSTPFGLLYLGTVLNQYEVTLPEPCVLTNGWVSIVGLGDSECWFLWMSSDLFGSSYCQGCIPEPQDIDFGVCLQGPTGGVFGACCDDGSGACVDTVEISDCAAADLRFVPDATCADLDPPCGTIVGACCFGDASCTIATEGVCDEGGGSWLGDGALCAQCPCITPCPPGGFAEREPTCEDEYEDTFNGGCVADEPAFSSIAPGQTACGESGIFEVGPDLVPDFDWYQITVPSVELVWTVTAEFRPQIWIVDAGAGCPGSVLASDLAFECETVSVSASVPPGEYWLVVAPVAFSDSSACGARYTARATIACTGDVNGDTVVDVLDLTAVILAWGTGDPDADISGDGVVGVEDLTAVILAWGDCIPTG